MPDNDLRRQPLNAGSRRMARDPADIYEQAEAVTCKGCVHIEVVKVMDATHEICAIGKGYGKRCKRYDEGRRVT